MTTPDFSKCFGCHEPIVVDPCVALYDRKTRGYPAAAENVVVGLYHRACLPEENEEAGPCYDVPISVLGGNEAALRHISQKLWCNEATAVRLGWALEEVDAIHRRYQYAQEIIRIGQRQREGAERARSITPHIRSVVMERDKFRCRRCGASAPDAVLVVDHIFPVKLGGGNGIYNLQTLCVTCNAGKRDRPPTDHDLDVTRGNG